MSLCEQGNFEMLFEMYYEKLSFFKNLKIHGYHPDDFSEEPVFRYVSNDHESQYDYDNLVYLSSRKTKFKTYQPIHYAAAHGDLDAVRKLVEKYKCSPKSYVGERKNNSLAIACYFGHKEVVEYLVKKCNCFEMDGVLRVLSCLHNEVLRHERYVLANKECAFTARTSKGEIKLNGKMGNQHAKIAVFLLRTHKFFQESTFLGLVLLHGEYEDLKYAPKKCLEKIPLMINFAIYGDNVLVTKELIKNGIITCDSELIATACRCHATETMVSLILSKCPYNVIFETIGGISLIDYVAEYYLCGKTESAKFLFNSLLEHVGDTEDSNGQNVLHYLIRNRYYNFLADQIEFISGKKPELCCRQNSELQLPLHVICSKMCDYDILYLQLVKALSCSCDINACDKSGNTPLHIACLNQNWKLLQYLAVDKQAKLEIKNKNGMIPIHYINLNYPGLFLRSLDPAVINEVDSMGNNLLHIACFNGYDISYIKQLVNKEPLMIQSQNHFGFTALHFISSWYWMGESLKSEKMEDIVDMLCHDETWKCTQDVDGNTPLHIACYNHDECSNLELMKYFVKKMPFLTAISNRAGELPIHIALGHQFLSVLKTDKKMFKRECGHCVDMPFLKLLLAGIDVDIQDREGSSPLHSACCRLSWYELEVKHALIKYLISTRGANILLKNKKGELPLHLFLKCGYIINDHLIDLLISSESFYIQDSEGNTPLHVACMHHYARYDVMYSFTTSSHFPKAIAIRNNAGHTPLQVALNSVKLSTQMWYAQVLLDGVRLLHINTYSTLCNPLLLHNCINAAQKWEEVFMELINPINANLRNEDGDTLLHVVCRSKYKFHLVSSIPNVLELINVKNCRGQTPLHVAAIETNAVAAKFLLEHKCIPNVEDSHGNIPLHFISENECISLKYLPITYADISKMNDKGYAPIHLVVLKCNFLAVKHFQEFCGSRVAAIASKDGKFPLQMILQRYIAELFVPLTCYNKMAGYLMKFSVDCNFVECLKENEKEVLIQLACQLNFVECLEYQEEERTFLVENCSMKSSPFCNLDKVRLMHMAAWYGRTDMLHYLLGEEELDPQTVDECGNNALAYAGRNQEVLFKDYFYSNLIASKDTIRLLKESGCGISDANEGLSTANIKSEKENEDNYELAIKNGSINDLQHLMASFSITEEQKISMIDFSIHCKQHFYKAAMLFLKSTSLKSVSLLQQTLSFKALNFIFRSSYLFSDSTIDLWSKITLACKYNNHKVMKKLLTQSGHASLHNELLDTTPLHIACMHNRPKIVKWLINHGAKVTAKNTDGDTPLHIASKNRLLKCAKIVFQNVHECTKIKNNFGNTPLHLACSSGSYACAILLSSGSLCIQNNLGDTPLHIACRLRSFTILYYLLTHSEQFIDLRKASSVTNGKGELPLHIALQSCGRHMVDSIRLYSLFLLAKLTPNLHEHHDLMGLACKCKSSQSLKIVQYLKSRGVEINVSDKQGKLPIHYASSENLAMVKFCASPTTINHQDSEGNTPLHIAVTANNYGICEYLVQGIRCDISIQNKVGHVALHMACNTPTIRTDICTLLMKDASFVPDSWGNYPLHYMCSNFTNDVTPLIHNAIDILTETDRMRVISHSNQFGELPIHFLCKAKSSSEAVSMLIPYTNNMNAKTLSGETPLHLACLSEQHDTINLLAEHGRSIPNASDDFPLHLACQIRILVNTDETLDYLQKAMGTDFKKELEIAVDKSYCFLSTIKCLCTETSVNFRNHNEDTPLLVLLKNNYLQYVYYECGLDKLFCKAIMTLLDHGAVIDCSNILKEFPIHLSCRYQNIDAVKLIGVCGISESTTDGKNVLHYACRNESVTYEFFSYLKNELDSTDLKKFGTAKEEVKGDTPFHVYCRTGQYYCEASLKFLFAYSDINSQNSERNTPFHLLLNGSFYNEKIVMEFIHNEDYDYSLANVNGETVLDLISRRVDDVLAKEIVVFHSSPQVPHRAHKLKNILSRANENFILMLFLSQFDIVKILADLDIDPTPLYKAHKALFNNKQEPLMVSISMLFIGDAMTGKTTLVQSLREEAEIEITEGEPERTAGIIPSSFQSPKYGKVTTYDFAGQREYYAGHESVMQNIIQKTPPIVLILVKLTSSEDVIRRQMIYWSNFVRNRLKDKLSMKSQLLVVCSRADQVNEVNLESVCRVIRSAVSAIDELELADIIDMDCRKSSGPKIEQLVTSLVSIIHSSRQMGITSFKAHCLYVFLMQQSKVMAFTTIAEAFHLQKKKLYVGNSKMLYSSDFQEFIKLCLELAHDGQILLLKENIIQRSVIVLNLQTILNEVSGKLFAPANFRIHQRVSSNTGVVTFSKLKSLFPQYDTNMVFKCLSSIEYCFEVQDGPILRYLLKQNDSPPSERYYFFPDLVSVTLPMNIPRDASMSGRFCWVLQCEEGENFSPRFIQLLLLRLVFSCTKSRNISESNAHIWTNGLFWCNGDGVETMVAVIDTSKVIVFMQQRKENYNCKLLKHRSICMNLVRELQHEICPAIHCKEYFIHPSHVKERIETIAINDHVLVPMDEIIDAVCAEKEFIDNYYNGCFKIDEVILFDPYAYLCKNLVKILLNKDYNYKVSKKVMEYLTDHFYKMRHQIFIELFGISMTELERFSTSRPVTGQFLEILKQWGRNTQGSIGELRQMFNSISIFATYDLQSGKNF